MNAKKNTRHTYAPIRNSGQRKIGIEQKMLFGGTWNSLIENPARLASNQHKTAMVNSHLIEYRVRFAI